MSDDLFGALLCTAAAVATLALTLVAVHRRNAEGAATCGIISGVFATTALVCFSRL